MGAGQRHTIGHARLLRPQPQQHQRPMRKAIRPNDTGGAFRASQHRGRQLAAFYLKGDRDAPHGCGLGKFGGIGQFKHVKTENRGCRYDIFLLFSPKHLLCKQKSSYLCSVNLRIGYPGRIPRGQDYIDTTH